MSNLCQLGICWLTIVSTAYPLFDLINSFGDIEHRVSILTLGLILMWLIAALLGGLLWFYFIWKEITEEK